MSTDRAPSADQPGRPASASPLAPGHDADRSPVPGAGEPDRRPGAGAEEELVLRRTPDGWQVGGAACATAGGAEHSGPGDGEAEVLPDLLNAMVLAELLAGDVPPPRKPGGTEAPAGEPGHSGTGAAGTAARAGGTPAGPGDAGPEAGHGRDGATSRDGADTGRLRATITQLEHALNTRVRIEQAIGILAERHRLPPRQAFDLLRKVARSGGSRVHDLAGEVVASATNPLLLLPAELGRQPLQTSARGRPRRQRPQ